MLINWFTVFAQIVNFLILVVLLKFLLYDRIVKAMNARQQAIATSLDEANEKQKEAIKEATLYRQKNRELEEQRAAMMDAARQEADARRKELTLQAQQEVGALEARWRQNVREQTGQFVQQLRESASRHACSVARRVLEDVAGADLHEQVIAAFVSRIETMDAAERSDLAESLKDAGAGMTIVSAFDIPRDRQPQLVRVVQALAPDGNAVHFERDPDLICGIKLRAGGWAVEWSIESYLDKLTGEFAEVLREEGELKEAPNETA